MLGLTWHRFSTGEKVHVFVMALAGTYLPCSSAHGSIGIGALSLSSFWATKEEWQSPMVREKLDELTMKHAVDSSMVAFPVNACLALCGLYKAFMWPDANSISCFLLFAHNSQATLEMARTAGTARTASELSRRYLLTRGVLTQVIIALRVACVPFAADPENVSYNIEMLIGLANAIFVLDVRLSIPMLMVLLLGSP